MILRLKLSHLGENILKSDFSQIWPNCENCNFTKFPAIRYNIFYHIIYYSSCNLALYSSRLTAYIRASWPLSYSHRFLFQVGTQLTGVQAFSFQQTYSLLHSIWSGWGKGHCTHGWLLQIAVLVLKCSVQITFLIIDQGIACNSVLLYSSLIWMLLLLIITEVHWPKLLMHAYASVPYNC